MRQNTSRHVWCDQYLEVLGPLLPKTLFSKVEFLKAVPVTMIANDKRNEKILSHLQILYFLFLIPFCPDDVLKYWSPLLPNSLEFLFSPSKKRGIRSNMFLPKNLWNDICPFLCVFSLQHFHVFWMFYCCLPCLIWST